MAASQGQPPMHFGGVVLPLHERYPSWESMHPMPSHLGSPPAGTNTPLKRLLDLSRLALSARIKQGVPLSELVSHFTTLCELEEELL